MRQFLGTLAVVWTAASIAAQVYSGQQNIPYRIEIALLPAFLIEIAFYLVPGFPSVRKAFDEFGARAFRAVLLTASAVLPYVVESWALGTFSGASFLLLLALVAVAAFWYAILPPNIAADLLFLAFMGAVYLTKTFDHIYGRPIPHVPLGILGRLMWIRLGLMAVLSLRCIEDVRFGFVPSWREWRLGVQLYVCFLPVGIGLAYALRFVHFQQPHVVWWKFALFFAGTFLAFLWVVALAEEFFFRAFLQRLLANQTRSDVAGLVGAALLFGSAHLWFGRYPNWRLALLGAAAGVFYGLALLKSRSVRASMITHALVATTWRMLFTS